MTDIDQQAVSDRLPLAAEQRKKLYAAITGVGPQTDSVIPTGSSAEPCSPVQPDCSLSHPVEAVSQTH